MSKKITFTKESKSKINNLNVVISSSLSRPDTYGNKTVSYFRFIEQTFERYVKSRQTEITTVGEDGLEDNTIPVQSINVSNINVVKTDNVLS